jgi:hypothetical protein
MHSRLTTSQGTSWPLLLPITYYITPLTNRDK